MDNEHTMRCLVVIMEEYLGDDPKEIMNLGLTCKELRERAHAKLSRTLMSNVDSYISALKSGYPMAIEQYRPLDVRALPIIEACLMKDRQALYRAIRSVV
jgi:hypothetical protein